MANLVSPGVQVSVTDESVYGSAGAGTVPMFFIATGQDKADPTGTEADGIAKYTKSANAGKPVLVTSQRELTQYFGNIDFRQVGGSVVQGDETNEYGLLAAYSFLGQAAGAYVVRADIDLFSVRPQDSEPTGPVANNTYWFNPASSAFGIFEYDGTDWNIQTPTVEIVSTAGSPTTTAVNGEYLVEVVAGTTSTEVHYYIGNAGNWDALDAASGNITFNPHYTVPTSPSLGDVWVKTTQPGGGVDVALSLYQTSTAAWVAQQIVYTGSVAPTGVSSDVFQDGTAGSARSLKEGDIWVEADGDKLSLYRWDGIQSQWDAISLTAATGGYVVNTSVTEPTGNPANGTVWFDDAVNNLHMYEVVLDGGVQKWVRVSDVQYGSQAPTSNTSGGALSDGDYWIDTDEDNYPVIYRHNGSDWVVKDNTDQSTSNGVVFGDITDEDKLVGSHVISTDVLSGGPDPLVFPVGTTGINMCRSGNTVRVYDNSLTTTWKWRNFAGNAASGAGSFGRKAQRKAVVTGLQASAAGTSLREDTLQFRLIATPGYPELMDEMTTLNVDRDETAFVIVDSPMRKNPTEIIDWVQGGSAIENGEDGLVSSSSYAAAYYPSVLTTDPVSGQSVVAPASHSVLYTIAYSDSISFQWFAPAGLTRGRVQNASNVGYLNGEGDFVPVSLTQGSTDVMYENKLNPISRFPNDGILLFGQKTLGTSGSALDRVNVARLTAYLRERFAVIARPYLFEPNDQSTRENAKATFDGFMGNIQLQRGVYDFAVVCDETNNTPARIDRNEFYVDVAIEPTKAAEFIYIPIRIVNTGELG